jgi:hypothetical protein
MDLIEDDMKNMEWIENRDIDALKCKTVSDTLLGHIKLFKLSNEQVCENAGISMDTLEGLLSGEIDFTIALADKLKYAFPCISDTDDTTHAGKVEETMWVDLANGRLSGSLQLSKDGSCIVNDKKVERRPPPRKGGWGMIDD